MKHLFFFLTVFLSLNNAWAQSLLEKNSSPSSAVKSAYSYAPQVESELILTWLTSDTGEDSYGVFIPTIVAPYMEFTPEDLINFNGTGKNPTKIKQIQFHVTETSGISDAKISIRQGTSLDASVVVYTQDITTLQEGWNNVDLTEAYTINPLLNLYVGYEASITPTGFLSLAYEYNPKQGWVYSEGFVSNLADMGLVFLIKAVAIAEDSPANGVTLQSLDIPDYAVVNDNISVKGVVKNLGSAPLTSLTLNYSVDGQEASPYHVTGLNIASGNTYAFTHPNVIAANEAKAYTIVVTAANPNGENGSSSKTTDLNVYSSIVQRILLHESFTSATCIPCKDGNANLLAVLEYADESKWVNIRYQTDIPTPGDPYYTAEVGNKRTFYGVGYVPYLGVDGIRFNETPNYYNIALFNQFSDIPAAAVLAGNAKTIGKTVSATISITPVISKNTQDFRLFAAIVEKTTTKNIKGNRETEFHNVMKKFLTDVEGDPIENFAVDVLQSLSYNYTFNGNYRLPRDARDPIDHATEHSVEDFGNLIVVYWIQNIQTGEVLQAGKTDAIFTTEAGLNEFSGKNTTVFVQDGSLFINTDVPVQSIDVYNVSGQKVLSSTAADKSISVKHLISGVYVLKMKTTEGEKIVKVIK